MYEAHCAVEEGWISPAVASGTKFGASSGAENSVTISVLITHETQVRLMGFPEAQVSQEHDFP